MLKPYSVAIEFRVVVLGESQEHAEEIAEDLKHEICSTEEPDMIFAVPIRPDGAGVPRGWAPGCLIYHEGTEEITLEAALENLRANTIQQSPGQTEIPELNKAVIPERPAPRLQRGIQPSSVNTSQPEEDP